MATCGAHWSYAGDDFELNCDLDSGHRVIFKNHYDALKKLEWNENEEPASVPYTPTGPIPKIKAGAAK
jgi:hypothetical protein